MPLHLLGKKSWNVYNQDNVERVRRDEADAQAREEAEEQRMQQEDAERRIAILRGEKPPPLPESGTGEEDSHTPRRRREDDDGPRIQSKRRRLRGEDDTDRDIRYAREDAVAGDKAKETLSRATKDDGPLADHAGHIQLFAPPAVSNEKNDEAEAEKARSRKREEDKYTMRFSNAAGFNTSLEKPWYSAQQQKPTIPDMSDKDVWGNADPLRKEREQKRLTSSDPFAAMQMAQKQLKQSEADKNVWAKERQREVDQLRRDEKESKKKRRHERRSRPRGHEDDLEGFSLDVSDPQFTKEVVHSQSLTAIVPSFSALSLPAKTTSMTCAKMQLTSTLNSSPFKPFKFPDLPNSLSTSNTLPADRADNVNLTTSSSPDNLTVSYFTDKLAIETRLQIYEQVFAYSRPLKYIERIMMTRLVGNESRARNKRNFEEYEVSHATAAPSLLFVCSQVYNEAIELFHAINTFTIDETGVLFEGAPLTRKTFDPALFRHILVPARFNGFISTNKKRASSKIWVDWPGDLAIACVRSVCNARKAGQPAFPNMPHLQSITVEAGISSLYDLEAELKANAEMTVTYEAVGVCKVNSVCTPQVKLTKNTLATAWATASSTSSITPAAIREVDRGTGCTYLRFSLAAQLAMRTFLEAPGESPAVGTPFGFLELNMLRELCRMEETKARMVCSEDVPEAFKFWTKYYEPWWW